MATPPKRKKRTHSQTPPVATSTPVTRGDASADNLTSEEFVTPTNSQEQVLVRSSAEDVTLMEAAPINVPSIANGGDSLADSSNGRLISPAARNAIFEGILSLSSTGAETTLPAFDAAVYDAVFEHGLLPVDQVRSFYASLTALVQLAKSKDRDFRVLVAEATHLGSVDAVASALDAGLI